MIEVIPGGNGLPLGEVAHLLVPGRGRIFDGTALSAKGLERAVYASNLWRELGLFDKDGVIVACGYKSPGDIGAEDYVSPEDGATYKGVPEADLLAEAMSVRGVPKSRIRRERRSIDTVTNLANAELGGHFTDTRPVAIVAQEDHLERIIKLIAPKVLRRDFLGIIVPEMPEDRDQESALARLATRGILLGISPDRQDLADVALRRAMALWGLANKFPAGRNYNIDRD